MSQTRDDSYIVVQKSVTDVIKSALKDAEPQNDILKFANIIHICEK